MSTPSQAAGGVNVFLNPGDLHFFRPGPSLVPPAKFSTLLGSCVSVILWHPEQRLAAMSHSLLPSRVRRDAAMRFDGRYCDEAVAIFCQELNRAKVHPKQFYAYLVGGGRMFASGKGDISIGDRNIEAARNALKLAGFLIKSEHIGDEGYRKLSLDLISGEVLVTYKAKKFNLMTGSCTSIVR